MFDDPGALARMRRAAAQSGAERYHAYAELDRSLAAREAPAAVYASGTVASLFSSRVGCQVNQPVYGISLGQLCLR